MQKSFKEQNKFDGIYFDTKTKRLEKLDYPDGQIPGDKIFLLGINHNTKGVGYNISVNGKDDIPNGQISLKTFADIARAHANLTGYSGVQKEYVVAQYSGYGKSYHMHMENKTNPKDLSSSRIPHDGVIVTKENLAAVLAKIKDGKDFSEMIALQKEALTAANQKEGIVLDK